MKNLLTKMSWMLLLFLPTSLFAWQWLDLWQTADQQGAELLQAGKPQQAAQVFKNKDWQGVAAYRAQNYAQAFERFKNQKTSDGQYNAGNAAAHLGRYQEAIAAYDKAIALNPNNSDAISNRDIIKKLMDKKNQQNNASNSKNSSHSADKNEKKNNDNQSDKSDNKQSAQNQNNSLQKNDSGKPSDQNKPQKNSDEKQSTQNNPKANKGQNDKQKQANNSSSSKNNTDRSAPENNGHEKLNTSARGQWQAEEDQKQVLRRLSDDPGGLLRQKFLRDYMRRHSNGNDIDEGEF